MTINLTDRSTVERYFALMQVGADGLDEFVALFDDQAVYIEPFGGQPQVHSGKDEIQAFFEMAFNHHLKDVRLTLDRLDVDGSRLRAEWTCDLPMFAGPMRGVDLLTLREGRIVRLETSVTEFPPTRS